jgi:colicin import membrane protein
MPRAPTITIEDVRAIADRLKAAGVKPTPRLILEEHGSGGLGTIYQLFKQWENRQEQHVDIGLTISPALQRAILEFMGRELANAKAELESKLADSEQRAAELARENERQVAAIDEQAELLVTLQDAAALQQGKLDQIELDLAAAREEALRERAAAESARTELAKEQLRLEAMPRLETDLAALRTTYEAERQTRIAAEQSAAVSAAQKDSLAERLAEDKGRIDALATQLAQEQDSARRQAAELIGARVAVEAANARLEGAARDVAASREAIAEARARECKAIEEAAELRGAHPAPKK